jgi:hypothetical protein
VIAKGKRIEMEERTSVQAVKGRSRGVVVGSLIAFGWAFYGASVFSAGVRWIALVAAAGLSAALILGAFLMIRRARAIPTKTSAGTSAFRRAGLWFGLNLVGEIVLLNVAVELLGAPDQRKFWIPAISAVVGFHFWPMAIFFRARTYWLVGAAMMFGAAVAALVISRQGDAASKFAYAEGLANAVVLWSALGNSVVMGRSGRAKLS